ncbi:hypothetical protein OH455_21970, partial [Vibrio sp. T11.5]|nr:hypothetical protein [Vibrio sp. T11.5]
EDYRSPDTKWLADKNKDKPSQYGLDVFTTANNYHLAADELAETMQKSHSEKKDGTLVVLFDPVGRQRDIAHNLKNTIAEGQAYRENNLYPLTIGTYAKACIDSPVPQVSQAAQENLDTQALTEFLEKSQLKMDKVSKQTQQWLALMDYFVAGEGATNEVGSLTCYLHHYFDLRQEGIVNPALELAKLLFLLGTLFEGVTASEHGMDTMDDWVGQAFVTDTLTPNDNALGIMFKGARLIFTQCQGGDWRELSAYVSKYMLISLGHFLARIPVAFSYVGQQAGKWSKIAANAGLERFYRTTFPKILDAILGVKINGNRVRVSLDEMEESLSKRAKQGRAATLWNKTKINWHEQLLDWSQVKANAKKTRILQLLELEITPSSPIETKIYFENSQVKTSLHFAGALVDVGFAAWSFYYNVLAMYDLASQQEYAELDPINDKDVLYTMGKMGSTLLALAADSAALTKYGAKSTNALASGFNRVLRAQTVEKYLPTIGVHLANKLGLENIMAYSKHVEGQVAKVPVRGLVVGANLMVAAIYFTDASTANRSGNIGLRDGYLIGGAASLLVIGSVASGPVGWAFFSVAMLGLFLSGYTIARFQKTELENLLFSCFWGKSKYYSFWADFTDAEKVKNVILRKKKIQSLTDEGKKQYLETALQIESQEFINYFYWPQLKIDKTTLSPQVIKSDKLYTFRFVLPEFKMGISQLHGTMVKKVYTRSGPASTEPMTEAFKHALLAAFNNPKQHEFKEDGLHLTVEVECSFGKNRGLASDLSLQWCYEPEPSLMVPKRMLTSSGSIKRQLIGMVNEHPNDKY